MKYKSKDNLMPMDWDALTKIEGPLGRHIEQLWDEIKKLKEEVRILKEKEVKHGK